MQFRWASHQSAEIMNKSQASFWQTLAFFFVFGLLSVFLWPLGAGGGGRRHKYMKIFARKKIVFFLLVISGLVTHRSKNRVGHKNNFSRFQHVYPLKSCMGPCRTQFHNLFPKIWKHCLATATFVRDNFHLVKFAIFRHFF